MLDRYDPARGGFASWLAVLARRVAVDLRDKGLARKRRAIALCPDGLDQVADPAAAAPPELLAAAEYVEDLARRVARVRGMLNALTPRQRDAVRKRFGLEPGGREHTFKEIDPAVSDEANREAVARGLAELRRRLVRSAGGD